MDKEIKTEAQTLPAVAGQVEFGVRPRRPKLAELAERIRLHLARLEADAEWNICPNGMGKFLWSSHASVRGNRIFCTYVSYQGSTGIKRDEAERYLSILDAGFKGRHFEALREQAA